MKIENIDITKIKNIGKVNTKNKGRRAKKIDKEVIVAFDRNGNAIKADYWYALITWLYDNEKFTSRGIKHKLSKNELESQAYFAFQNKRLRHGIRYRKYSELI